MVFGSCWDPFVFHRQCMHDWHMMKHAVRSVGHHAVQPWLRQKKQEHLSVRSCCFAPCLKVFNNKSTFILFPTWRSLKTTTPLKNPSTTCTAQTNDCVHDLDGQNRQSLAFSKRGQPSQVVPQIHVQQLLCKWTPIAQFKSQHNEHNVYEDRCLCFGEDLSANGC